MVEMNPQTGPLERASGVLAVETPDGHQQWALVVDAQIRYGNDVTVSYGSSPQFTVVATLPPGEMLRKASTLEAGEENVLVYSRLLVAVLREERDRYAELEKELGVSRRTAQHLREKADADERDLEEAVHAAWADGARNGYVSASAGLPVEVALERNPHPEPEDEEPGCHICGGPDH